MIHKTLVEATDGAPACPGIAGAFEGHCVVEKSGCVVVYAPEFEGILVWSARMEDDTVALFLPQSTAGGVKGLCVDSWGALADAGGHGVTL